MSQVERVSCEDEIVCPYCREEYQDSWDYGCDSGETNDIEECHSCGKKFHWTRHLMVTYDSVPDCELNGEEHGYVQEEDYKNYHCFRCGVCDKLDMRKKSKE